MSSYHWNVARPENFFPIAFEHGLLPDTCISNRNIAKIKTVTTGKASITITIKNIFYFHLNMKSECVGPKQNLLISREKQMLKGNCNTQDFLALKRAVQH